MKTKTSMLVATALLSLGASAVAGEMKSAQFFPVEQLSPRDRALIAERIKAVEKVVRIDWESVAAGINEHGELTLKDKLQAQQDRVSNPSCWSAAKNGNE